MISCDEEEYETGNGAEIEKTQTQWQEYYPKWNEREENLVYTLLDLSEKQTEDEKSMQCFIARGWDEAVQGWGYSSPFACLQTKRNSKKPKPREDINGCILCSEMLKVSDKPITTETNPSPEQTLLDGKSDATCVVSVQENVLPPSEELSYSPHSASSSSSQLEVSKIDTYGDKRYSAQKNQGDIQQANELLPWCQENTKSQGASMFRECKDVNPEPTVNSDCSNKEPLSLNTFVVLPPVRAAFLNDRSFSAGRKSKGALVQQQLKVPSQVLIEDHLYGSAAKKLQQKAEGGDFEQIRLHKSTHLIGPIISRGPLLQEAERFYWQCSFVPGKNNATINGISSKHYGNNLSNLGLVHAQVSQSKPSTTLNDLRAPLAQQLRNPSGSKRRNRRVVPTSPLPQPILPSITVTRVEIPISSYRLM
ncbi:uncharacterized protein C16orf46 homolog [Ambystoma mexicanum]|uniref:uncharacterized protein C16orf46 homolog n=1 Tax=Ambystoma mexicanum TaxID=8296 RepID=UPI0037E7AC0C